MEQSGTTTLDEWLGGALPGRLHLLVGGPGAGKTSTVLHFLDAGLRRGERAALLTSERASDLRSHAAHIGVDLRAPLLEDRLSLLRYRSAFSERAGAAAAPQAIAADLRRMLGAAAPRRVAIDTVSPFLGDGVGTGAPLAALVDMLEAMSATAVVSVAGDLAPGGDRRLEPLLERAAVILRFRRESGSSFRIEIARARHAFAVGPPQSFEVVPRGGLRRLSPAGAPAAATPAPAQASAAPPRPGDRRLLLLHHDRSPSAELLALLGREYELTAQRVTSVLPDAGVSGVGAILIETAPEWVSDASGIVRQRASAPGGPAIIVCARFNLRSADRARLLGAGADEVVATDMSPPELRTRVAAAVARGHLQQPSVAEPEPVLTQSAAAGGRAAPLDGPTFAKAVAGHVARDAAAHHTVVQLTLMPAEADGGGARDAETLLNELADTVMRCMRVASGDLVAVGDGKVSVYLHGARHDDAAPFVERLRARWSKRAGGGLRLRVDLHSHPPGTRRAAGAPSRTRA